MEIGKNDLAKDVSLNLLLLKKEITYHGIVLDRIFRSSGREMKSKLIKRLLEGIEAGFVKPLPRLVFNAAQVEESYRYMMTGKHIGKILIKLRNEEEDYRNVTRLHKLQISSKQR